MINKDEEFVEYMIESNNRSVSVCIAAKYFAAITSLCYIYILMYYFHYFISDRIRGNGLHSL